MPAGSKPGERRGGRKPGSQNKQTIAKAQALVDAEHRALEGLSVEDIEQLSPLAVMLLAMRTAIRDGKLMVASAVAKEAAPYLHPKLSSETHRVLTDDSRRDEDEIRRELAEISALARASTEAGTVAEAVPEEPSGLVH